MLDGPFRGSDALRAGLLTRGALRGSRFTRVFPDVYVPATLPPTFEVRSRAASLVAESRGGVVGGYSAAALLGASCEPPGAPAEIRVPVHCTPVRGLVARQGTVDPKEIVEVDGVRVTDRLRTAWDLGRSLGLHDAVVAVDALARPERHGLPPRFDPFALLDRRLTHPRARGSVRLDQVVVLADPRAESPMETRARLMLVIAGLRPEVQFELVTADGIVVARFDLAFPRARLAIEYDGEEHDDVLDRARDLRTGSLGWHTMRLRAVDVLRRPDRTVDLVRHQVLHRTALIAADRALRVR